MTAWNNNPNNAVPQLIPGVPCYLAGHPSHGGPTTRLKITRTSLATNVVTLTGTVVEGNIPSVGDLIYVSGLTRDSGGLNTSVGIAIASVSINATTGVGTITYPITAANLADAAEAGDAYITAADVPETNVPSQAYQAVAVQRDVAQHGAERTATIWVNYPSAPASIKWSLQGAMENNDAEYVDLLADIAAGGTFSDSGAPAFNSSSAQFYPGSWNFFRFKDTGSSGGTLPTVVARIII